MIIIRGTIDIMSYSSEYLVPGLVFVLFGTWWGFVTAIRHLHSRMKLPVNQNTRLGYKSTTTMPCIILPCSSARLMPIESFIKLTLASIALFLEGYSSLNEPSVASNQFQNGTSIVTEPHQAIKFTLAQSTTALHLTMYSAFLVSSLAELLVYFEMNLPERFEFVCGAMAFLIEAFMLASSPIPSSSLEQYVRRLLVYAVIGSALFVICEFLNRREVLFTFARNLFTILQGTWRIQMALMLNSTNWAWDPESHESITFASIAFCWHIMLILIFLLIQLWFVQNFVIYLNRFNSDELILIDHFNSKLTYDQVNTEDQETELGPITVDDKNRAKLQ